MDTVIEIRNGQKLFRFESRAHGYELHYSEEQGLDGSWVSLGVRRTDADVLAVIARILQDLI